jgi:hypothetical protein
MSLGPISKNELLARYIVFSRWFHKKDHTIKQDAFIPNSSLELSVTRHLGLSEDDIWRIGEMIAEKMSRTLHGRADVETAHIIAQSLNVVPHPVPDNPNHANVINWPLDKGARKMCALEIARGLVLLLTPK